MTSPKPVTPSDAKTDTATEKQTFPTVDPREVKQDRMSDDELDGVILDAQAKLDAYFAEAAERASKKPFQPHVAPGSTHELYQVQKGDTLLSIAGKLGLASSYHDLFQPNMGIIEESAKANGHPGGSDQGSVLIPGIWLEYTPSGVKKPE